MNFSIAQEKNAEEPTNSIEKFMKRYTVSDSAKENRVMTRNGASTALTEMQNSIPELSLYQQTESVLQKMRNLREAKEKTVSFFWRFFIYFIFVSNLLSTFVNISLCSIRQKKLLQQH